MNNKYDGRSEDLPKDAPHSAEAEQAVIGIFLTCAAFKGDDNQAALYDEVSQIVKPEHFYNPIHEKIISAIYTRCRRRQLVDPIVLKNRFSQDESLKEIGGVEYLALLCDNAPDHSSAPLYAQLIADLANKRSLILLGQEMVKMAKDPDTDDDAYAVYEGLKHDMDAMRSMFPANAVFTEMADAALEGVEEVGQHSSMGMSTGLPELDKCIGGLHRGDFIVIGGRPRHGKTSLASNILRHRAHEGVATDDLGDVTRPSNCLFFSLEMTAQQIGMRSLSHWVYEKEGIEIEYRDIMNHNITVDEKQLLLKHLPEMKKKWRIHVDATKGLTATEMIARSRAYAKKYGPLDVVVGDYAQRMSYNDTDARNEHQGMNEVLARLADFAGEDRLCMMLLSQLTREVDRRDGHRPVISDLRGSGGYEEHATIIAFLKREIVYLTEKGAPKARNIDEKLDYEDSLKEWENRAEIIVAKNKRGPEDTLLIGAQVQYDRFHSLSDNQERFEL